MRHFWCLLSHELRVMFISPATYVAAFLFLLLMGFIYLLSLDAVSREPSEQLPSELFFQLFWLPVFFMVPLLTMRSLAEERRQGTLETLMTTPASAAEVVFSKFASAYLLYLLLWGLTFGFPLIVRWTVPAAALEVPLFDFASLAGGFLFIAVSGTLYIALGIFASSLTRTQLVAGMLSFSLLFVLIISGRLMTQLPMVEVGWLSWVESSLDYFQTFKHLEDFGRGVIDSRPLVLYLSNTLLLLGITVLVVEAKA